MKLTNKVLTDDEVCMTPESWAYHAIVVDRVACCIFMANGVKEELIDAGKAVDDEEFGNMVESFKEDFTHYRDWGYEVYEQEERYYVVDTTCGMFCEVENPHKSENGLVRCVGDWDDLMNEEDTNDKGDPNES